MFSWHYREGNKGKGRKWFPSRSSVHYICCTCMVVYRVAVYVHAGTTNDECICVVHVLNFFMIYYFLFHLFIYFPFVGTSNRYADVLLVLLRF